MINKIHKENIIIRNVSLKNIGFDVKTKHAFFINFQDAVVLNRDERKKNRKLMI
jgi:hypothetical protein